MRLRELIDALARLESICGADTETEVMGCGLSIKTEVTYANEYGYAHARTEKRKISNMITISSLPLAQPYQINEPYDAADHVSQIP
jgi:hypothetical protein